MSSSILPTNRRNQIQKARTKEQETFKTLYGEKKVGTAVTDSIQTQEKAHDAKQSQSSSAWGFGSAFTSLASAAGNGLSLGKSKILTGLVTSASFASAAASEVASWVIHAGTPDGVQPVFPNNKNAVMGFLVKGNSTFDPQTDPYFGARAQAILGSGTEELIQKMMDTFSEPVFGGFLQNALEACASNATFAAEFTTAINSSALKTSSDSLEFVRNFIVQNTSSIINGSFPILEEASLTFLTLMKNVTSCVANLTGEAFFNYPFSDDPKPIDPTSAPEHLSSLDIRTLLLVAFFGCITLWVVYLGTGKCDSKHEPLSSSNSGINPYGAISAPASGNQSGGQGA
jgi:hypothetical protein